MNKEKNMLENDFLIKLSEHLKSDKEISLKEIYSLFTDVNRKTISWRLHSLVQQRKIYRTGHGIYSMTGDSKVNEAVGYEYLQRKSKIIYDTLMEYGYNFYITGLDSLIGEILHMPENYPVLVIIQETNMKVIQEVLNDKEMIVLTEKDLSLLEKTVLRNKVDVILLKGKDFTLATDNISQKEKGFVDLYYAVTRLDYGVSVPELSRIYQSLRRNDSVIIGKMKSAAKDRNISNEINWLIELNKASDKAKEFMSYQIEEARWN